MKLVSFVMQGFDSSAGLIMWIILLFFFFGLGLAVERVWYLYIKADLKSRAFMRTISNYLKAADYDRAIKYATTIGSPLSKGILAVLQNREKGPKVIRKAVDEVFLTEGPRVKRNIHLLNTLANLATLTGLTGTIFGTMECFAVIAKAPAAQRASMLAEGISITMSATLWGLLVAVPCILAHGIISGKADKIMEDMDEKVLKLTNALEE